MLQDDTDSGFVKPGECLLHKYGKYGRRFRTANGKLCDQSVSGDLCDQNVSGDLCDQSE